METLYALVFFLLSSNLSSHKVQGLTAEKIIGGELADLNSFKHVVAVMYKVGDANGTHRNMCTGTIIDDWHIVTVAHCLYDQQVGGLIRKEVFITLSAADLQNPSNTTKYYPVNLLIIPAGYNPLGSNSHEKMGNIAILKLTFRLGLRRGHKSFKKLRISRDRYKFPLQSLTVAAYGWNEINFLLSEENGVISYIRFGQSDGKLRYANAEILSVHECLDLINGNIASDTICVKIKQNPDERKGICQGDSGAPLAHGNFLIAIAVAGFPECNENRMPGIYLDIALYAKHITAVIEKTPYNDSQVLLYELRQVREREFQFVLI